MRRVLVGLLLVVMLLSTTVSPVVATGAWNGQDSLHVPMAWCAVQGSPAATNPNIGGDTTTDALIWRRHERPTDNIFANPSGITLRSAIQNVWGTLNYPVIADPNTALGVQGDMRGENVNTFGAEYNTLIASCDTAWTNLGYAGIGVTMINANLFHDGTGNYAGIIGWAGCNEFPAGTCVAPYDGRVVVIDNLYLFPGVFDDTFPPSPADPAGNLMFPVKDPLDQLTGHEVGHSLSLNHRTDPTALMNPNQVDNDGDGLVDNIGLNNAEVIALRANALNVPGLETDPPGEFLPGRYAVQRQVDKVQEDEVVEFPPYLDLASVKLTLDKEKQRVSVGQQQFDLLPREGEPVDFWYLLDVDGEDVGADPEQLREFGVPETEFRGADILARVQVQGRQPRGEAFRFFDGEVIPIDDFFAQLHTMVMYPHFADLSGDGGELPKDRGYPIHDIVTIDFHNDFAGVEMGEPIRIHTLNVVDGERVVDALGDPEEGQGEKFVLLDPSFPHCFPEGDGVPGETVPIGLEGLLPNAPIHGLLGPELVFKGETDADGGGVIDFPIPEDAAPGYHLVTVGVDETALTADCLIRVEGEEEEQKGAGQGPVASPDRIALLQGYGELLQGQQGLLEQLVSITGKMKLDGLISDQQMASLAESYAEVARMQADLLQRYQVLLSIIMQE